MSNISDNWIPILQKLKAEFHSNKKLTNLINKWIFNPVQFELALDWLDRTISEFNTVMESGISTKIHLSRNDMFSIRYLFENERLPSIQNIISLLKEKSFLYPLIKNDILKNENLHGTIDDRIILISIYLTALKFCQTKLDKHLSIIEKSLLELV